jgi:hypothetical protein
MWLEGSCKIAFEYNSIAVLKSFFENASFPRLQDWRTTNEEVKNKWSDLPCPQLLQKGLRIDNQRDNELYVRLVFFGGFPFAHGDECSTVSWIVLSFSRCFVSRKGLLLFHYYCFIVILKREGFFTVWPTAQSCHYRVPAAVLCNEARNSAIDAQTCLLRFKTVERLVCGRRQIFIRGSE